MEHHNYSFFGQKSALILDSGELADPCLYLRFLKKLPEGRWEKPSVGEGKNLKFNLLEITEILQVLRTPNSQWSTVHKFHEASTSIKVTHQGDKVQFFVTGYAKPLMKAEIVLLADLWEHIYREKIEHATGSTFQKSDSSQVVTYPTPSESKPVSIPKKNVPNQIPALSPEHSMTPADWISHLQKEGEFLLVPGEVTSRREKALSYQVVGQNTIWVPLSQIKKNNPSQSANIWIKEWFVSAKLGEIFPPSQVG